MGHKIDFTNEKDDRLYFYEKYNGKNRVEYAYIEPNNPDIVYKTEENDIHHWPKNEMVGFLLFVYNKIAGDIFGERVDLKSKSSKPRYGLKIQGKTINVIHFLIKIDGLLNTLKYLGIEYMLTEKKVPDAQLHISIEDDKDNTYRYLAIFSKTPQEEYMVNGLLDGLKMISPIKRSNLNSKDIFDPFLKTKGESFARNLHELERKFIDQTTANILKMYNMPTTMKELLGKFMPKYLLNANVQDFNDLETQRIRMAEAISNSAYKTFGEAIGRLRNLKQSGKDFNAKMVLDPLAVIKQLQESGMLQYTQTTNPIEEINLSTKITKTGVNNMKADQVTLQKRDLNPSYYGVIAPVSTNEYGNVGNTQTLTNKATVVDRFGSIQKREFTDDINPFDLLSASESLQAFYEYDDTTRRVMGNQQFGQFVQLDNPDEPLVQTSFESVVPYIVSDRFAIKAKKDGAVKKITDEFIEVKNSDGTLLKYSVAPTRSRTKRGIYIPMKYYVKVSVGQKIRKGDILATTSSLKTGKLASGKNLVVAEMSYRGMNYEDGWVITPKVQEKYESTILEKITALIPPDAKIIGWNAIKGKNTNPGEILLSYTGSNIIDKFVDDDPENENVDDVLAGVDFSGANVSYRSPGGKIVDIVIKLNTKDIDSKLIKLWKESTKKIEERMEECKLLKHDHKAYVDCISDIQNTEILKIGGHSVNGTKFDGASVEIFVEKPNKIGNGSKFVLAATGGKGTVQYIIPKGKEPIAKETKLEIEFIPTPLSIVSRKNISILLLMYSGKVVYFLNKQVQELAQANKFKEARELILEVFTHLDASKEKFLVNEFLGFWDSKSQNELRKFILNSDPLSRPAFPLLVPPHKNKITIKNIEEAAKVLDIPLNEKVYIPEEDSYTEREVPVGIIPINYLEHFSKAMSSARGSLAVKRQFTTGQGRSGTRVGAGAIKLGLYDLFGMAYKEPGFLLKEIHGLHSDNAEARKKFQKEILKTVKMPDFSDIKIEPSNAKAKKLVEVFFRGAMLEPDF